MVRSGTVCPARRRAVPPASAVINLDEEHRKEALDAGGRLAAPLLGLLSDGLGAHHYGGEDARLAAAVVPGVGGAALDQDVSRPEQDFSGVRLGVDLTLQDDVVIDGVVAVHSGVVIVARNDVRGGDGLEVLGHLVGPVLLVGHELHDPEPTASGGRVVFDRARPVVLGALVGGERAVCYPQLVEDQPPSRLFEHGAGRSVEHEVRLAVLVGGGDYSAGCVHGRSFPGRATAAAVPRARLAATDTVPDPACLPAAADRQSE